MSIEELKKRFIVSEDHIKDRLEALVNRALNHCVIDEKGRVHIENKTIGGKDRIKLALAARYLGSQLDPNIKGSMTSAELEASTGLPMNQVRARVNDAINDTFAEKIGDGSYKPYANKIEAFLQSLPNSKPKKED